MGMTCLFGIWLVVVFDCRKPGSKFSYGVFLFLDRSKNFLLSQEPGSDYARACWVEIPGGPRACGDIFQRMTSPKVKFPRLFFCSLVIPALGPSP